MTKALPVIRKGLAVNADGKSWLVEHDFAAGSLQNIGHGDLHLLHVPGDLVFELVVGTDRCCRTVAKDRLGAFDQFGQSPSSLKMLRSLKVSKYS